MSFQITAFVCCFRYDYGSSKQEFLQSVCIENEYALFNDSIDVEGIVKSFAEHVVGANKKGVQAGENDEVSKSPIRDGIAFYRNIGVRLMVILEQEVQTLDGLHMRALLHLFKSMNKRS